MIVTDSAAFFIDFSKAWDPGRRASSDARVKASGAGGISLMLVFGTSKAPLL